jgi:hypothetical protein
MVASEDCVALTDTSMASPTEDSWSIEEREIADMGKEPNCRGGEDISSESDFETDYRKRRL